MSILAPFHPAVQTWFQDRLGEPTPPQRQGWPASREGRNTLIAAPTGSGKTLAAFLSAIDSLIRQGSGLKDETQVLYVSPLRALSNDVQKNLQGPLAEIRALDPSVPEVRVLVRTGDTPAGERTAMTRRPPHILVTTPESLYLLLTSEGGRKILRTVSTVIVDEIHALIRDKRGSHLALSLERLEHLAGRPIQRVGLSATQKPLDEVGRFLVGGGRECTLVDAGTFRTLDLGIEVPPSPLATVCSHEQWEEIYARIADEVRDARVDLLPLLVRADGRERRRRHLDPEVQRAERAGVDERAFAPTADQEAADLVERLLRRREAHPLNGPAGEMLEALERESEMTASLVADERVNLVDDDRRDRPENLPAALARQEEIERLRRRHEDVRRPARHRRALSRGRVARSHEDAHLRNRRVESADLGERPLQVLLNVVRERAQRRDVEDLRLVLQPGPLSDQRIDRREERRERLARAGRGRDERVAPLPDRRPALALRRRGLAEPVLKPRLNGGVKGGEERHRDAILTIRGRTTRPERHAWRRARIEKETEGMTLVSTRHGNRQRPFAPLHPRAPAIE